MIIAAVLIVLAVALLYCALQMLIAAVRLAFWLCVALLMPPGLWIVAAAALIAWAGGIFL